jgi:hypothetical protein
LLANGQQVIQDGCLHLLGAQQGELRRSWKWCHIQIIYVVADVYSSINHKLIEYNYFNFPSICFWMIEFKQIICTSDKL